MSQKIDLPTVINTLDLPLEFNRTRDIYITCPECGGVEKCNVDPTGDGLVHCVLCGFGGSPFDIWAWGRQRFDGVVIEASDRREFCRLVAKDFYSYTGSGSRPSRPRTTTKAKPKEQPAKVFELASPEVLNDTYTALFSELTLSEKHREALRRRGFPDEIIDRNGYKSAPTVGNDQIAHKLLASGHRAEGVPALYKPQRWSVVNYGPGIWIPCRSIDGRIHGVQERTDDMVYSQPLEVLPLPFAFTGGTLKMKFEDGVRTLRIGGVFDVDGKSCVALNPDGTEEVYLYGFKEHKEDKWIPLILKEAMFEKAKNAFLGITSAEGLHKTQRGLHKKAKYMTVSTKNRPYGTPGPTKPHFNPGWDGGCEVVLTEGPLKGDLISLFTGKATLSVLGVGNLAYVPDLLWELRQQGKTFLRIAYDMDMYVSDKQGVRNGLNNLERMLIHAGYRYGRIDWKEEYQKYGLKGYDDYLFYQYSN